MRVLIVGSGGREHALAWALKKSPEVSELFVATGNGGTSRIAENIAIPAASSGSSTGIVPATVAATNAGQALNGSTVATGDAVESTTYASSSWLMR